MNNNTNIYFYTFFSHPKAMEFVAKDLGLHKQKWRPTYHPDVYKSFNDRLRRIYERNNMYPLNFLKVITQYKKTGFVLLVDESELDKNEFQNPNNFYIHTMNKNHDTNIVDVFLQNGGIVVLPYYFDGLETYEKYATQKFKSNNQSLNIPEYDTSLLIAHQAFMKHDLKFCRLNNMNVQRRLPKYMAVFDNAITGLDLYNTDGNIIPTSMDIIGLEMQNVTSVSGIQGSKIISEFSENIDFFITTPEFLCTPEQLKNQKKIAKQCELNGIPYMNDQGCNAWIVKQPTKGNEFYIGSCYKLPKNVQPTTEQWFKWILFSTYISGEMIFDDLPNSRLELISPIQLTIDDAAVSIGKRLDSTFIGSQSDISLNIVSAKGSGKSHIKRMLRENSIENKFDCIITDSDDYGEWLSKEHGKNVIEMLMQDYKEFDFTLLNTMTFSPSRSLFYDIIFACVKVESSIPALSDLFFTFYNLIIGNSKFGIRAYIDYIKVTNNVHRVISFWHTMYEANLSPPNARTILITPNHDTRQAVFNRKENETLKVLDVILHDLYKSTLPLGLTIDWMTFLILVYPKLLLS